jgi:phenylpyruvate C(3)-methyltransferase
MHVTQTTTCHPDFTTGPTADIFSSYVVTVAVSAAHELGLLSRLDQERAIELSQTISDELDPGVVRQLLATLAWADIVQLKHDKALAGPRFDEVYAARGYYYWLVRGCGELFSIAPEVAFRARRSGNFFNRNMRAVAVGSRLIGDTEVEPLFDELLAGHDVGTVADLGCGSGQRLLRIAGRHPRVRGIGIDIARDAVDLASKSIADAAMDDRIRVVHGDVLDLPADPAFADVDVVTCVFMGHDFWPLQRCVAGLTGLRLAFPGVRRLLLCDVVRTDGVPGPGTTTIFTLGFELIHALMGVYLPSREEWLDAFHAAGWSLVAEHAVSAPPSGILFELRPCQQQL